MAERVGDGSPSKLVTGIYIDLPQRKLVFDVDGQPQVILRLASYGLVLEQVAELEEAELEATAPQQELQPEKTVTLTGRLHTTPKPGRADRAGNPTAYAQFAAHVEGEPEVHLYVATFHRGTDQLALKLRQQAQITVEGYPHVGDPSGGRLDTLSVIRLLDYPGKNPPRRSS